ncbi:MAG: hypothetical protein U9N34_05760 [Candidatus Cloacimonadota bacterium]|nr:hypothetical protein [Candidatus Cloacimonadota bacterium]
MSSKKIVISIIFLIFVISTLFGMSESEKRSIIKFETKLIKAFEEKIEYYKEIANRKVEMNNLAKQGEFKKLRKEFIKDKDVIVNKLSDNDFYESDKILKITNMVFKKIPEISGDLKLLLGYSEYVQGNDNRVVDIFEKVVVDYPNTDVYKEARYYLADSYIRLNENTKLIRLLENSNNLTDFETFLLANGYFNNADYKNALEIVNNLSNKEDYIVKANQLIGLVNFAQDDFDASERILKSLTIKDYEDYEAYPLSFLFLGRLFYEKNDLEKSLSNYLRYNEFVGSNIPEAVLFEMGSVFMENGDIEKSQIYLDKLISKNTETIYVNEAHILLAKINKELGNSEKALDYLENAVEEVHEINKILDRKLSYTSNPNYKEKESIYQNTNDWLQTKNIGPASQSFSLIQSIEKSQIDYQKRISELEHFVKTLKKNNDPHVVKEIGVDSLLTDYVDPLKEIDRSINGIDATSVKILTYMLIESRDYITFDDFSYAKYFANQIYDLHSFDYRWEQIQKIAQNKQKIQVVNIVKGKRKKLKTDIAATKLLAYYMFGKPNKDSSRFQSFTKEFDFLQEKKSELYATRDLVYESFNKIIANKVLSKKEKVEELLASNQKSHTELIMSIKNYSNRLVEKYEFEKIDLLYQQAIDLTIQE